MKRIFFVITAFAMLVSCKPAANEATISGTVNNPTSEHVEVHYYKNLVGNPLERVEVALDANNSFTATLPLSQGQFVYVFVPGRNVRLYLIPGAEVHVTFDAADPETAPVVQGKKALESQFLVSYVHEVERKHGRMLMLNMAGDLTAEEFLGAAEGGYNEKKNFLENHESFRKLDREFVSLLRTNMLYDKYNLLLEYPMAFSHFHPEAGEPVFPEGYFDFLEKDNLFGDEFASSRSYFRFLQLYLNRKLSEEFDPQLSFAEQTFNLAETELSGLSREMVLGETVIMGLGFLEMEQAKGLFDRFKALASNQAIIDIVQQEYDAMMAVAPGQPAPDFTLADINGNQVSLSDFVDKVVYLDFWASWCGPCMREVPYAKELKKRMAKETDLVFLYISVDSDANAWRNTVVQQQIQGVHLNVPGFDHEVPQSFNLRGVPTFFIIGRDGKIIDNRPPRPSDPEIDRALKEALAM